MLNIEHIKKSFHKNTILKDVSFNVENGRLCALEGKNGAGKSTLFNIILGNNKADFGKIAINDKPMPQSSSERAKNIAVLMQDPKASTVSSLTLLENLTLALLKNKRASLKLALTNTTKEKIIKHLEFLGLNFSSHLNNRMGSLSGGQRQIITFAMATIQKPKLLLLDEPTAALDEHASKLLMTMVKKLIKKWHIPCLMISHDKDLNQEYADNIITLKDGVISES